MFMFKKIVLVGCVATLSVSAMELALLEKPMRAIVCEAHKELMAVQLHRVTLFEQDIKEIHGSLESFNHTLSRLESIVEKLAEARQREELETFAVEISDT